MKSEDSAELVNCVGLVVEDMWAELHGTSVYCTALHVRNVT